MTAAEPWRSPGEEARAAASAAGVRRPGQTYTGSLVLNTGLLPRLAR
jgi:hypothetical protein